MDIKFVDGKKSVSYDQYKKVNKTCSKKEIKNMTHNEFLDRSYDGGIIMEIDFEDWKKIYDAIKNASDNYVLKSFKPWESDGGKQYITIQLVQKE